MINKYFKIAWCLKNTWLMINKYFKIAWCLKNTWIKILPQVFQQVFKNEFLCGFSPPNRLKNFCVCPCMSALHSIFSTCPTCTACVLLWRHVPKNFLSATGGTLEQLQSGITMSSDNRIDSFLGHELRVARSLYRRHVTEWVSLWNIWQVFKVEFRWDSDDRIGSNFISWHRVCLLYIPKAQFCQLQVYKWKKL